MAPMAVAMAMGTMAFQALPSTNKPLKNAEQMMNKCYFYCALFLLQN